MQESQVAPQDSDLFVSFFIAVHDTRYQLARCFIVARYIFILYVKIMS